MYTVKPVYNGTARDQNYFVAGRFFFTQVLEVWILGTVKVFHY